MDRARRRRRGRIQVGLAAVAAALAVLSAVLPEWIEALFGVEPDAGNGAAEWAIVLGLLVVAVVLGARGRSDLRSLRTAEAGRRP
jgi:hypothetical protein